MIEAGPGNAIPGQPSAAGPEMLAAPAPAIETKSELESGRSTIDEMAGVLSKMARQAARGDYLERGAYTDAIKHVAPLGAVTSTAASIVNALTHTVDAGVTFFAVSAGSMLEFWRAHYSQRNAVPKVMEQGYAFQCIRAQQDSSEINAGEVVVALHPRQYPGGRKEPADLASMRLGAALGVVERASGIDKIMLPQSAVDATGLPFFGRRSYSEAVSSIKQDRVISPYPDGERAVVLPKSVAAEVMNILELGTNADQITSRALSKLASRQPAYSEALTLQNEKLMPVLHSILQTILQAELPGSWRQRYDRNQEAQRADFRDSEGERVYSPGTAKHQDYRRPLITEIDVSNPYNPRIRQRKTTFESVLSQDLSEMSRVGKLFEVRKESTASEEQADDDEGANDAVRAKALADEAARVKALMDKVKEVRNKIECEQYSDLELVSVALQLLERSEDIEEAERGTSATSEEKDFGEAPHIIKSGGHEKATRVHKLTRLVAHAAMIGSGIMGSTAAVVAALPDKIQLDRPAALIEPEVWRYEKHGIDIPKLHEGYWTTDISYRWTPENGWVGSLGDEAKRWHAVDVPTEIDPATQYIMLSTVTNQQPVLLPQHDSLGIVAVRVTDQNGNNLGRSVLASDEGVVQVSPAIERGRIFKVSVDLGGSKGVNVVPNKPLNIEGGTGPIKDVGEFPGATEGPTAQANDMNVRFTYDNSDKLDARLKKEQSPQEFVREVYEVGRCNCWQCAQALAMSQAVAYPDYPMAYATGFLHDHSKDGDHGYLSIGHAWLNEGGGVTDPTPSRLDAHSEPPIEQPVAELDRQWGEAQRRIGWRPIKDGKVYELSLDGGEGHTLPLKPIGWTLGTIAAALVVEQEVRNRAMRNAVSRALVADRWISAHQQLDVRRAFALLGLAAYGRPGSAANVSQSDLRTKTPHPTNIPRDVLERAKRGELARQLGLSKREARGLKYAAAAELAHRRLAMRRNANQKS